jgi:hypothetical protein
MRRQSRNFASTDNPRETCYGAACLKHFGMRSTVGLKHDSVPSMARRERRVLRDGSPVRGRRTELLVEYKPDRRLETRVEFDTAVSATRPRSTWNDPAAT